MKRQKTIINEIKYLIKLEKKVLTLRYIGIKINFVFAVKSQK